MIQKLLRSWTVRAGMANPSSTTQQVPGDKQEKHSLLHTFACSTLLLLILLLLAACLVIWFKVHPDGLRYTVEDAILTDLSFFSVPNPRSKVNATEDMLHSAFFIVVSTYNPNYRVRVNYTTIDMTVDYKGQVLAFGPVEPFVHHKGGKHWLNSTVSSAGVRLLPSVVEDLKKIKKPGDTIMVDVRMRARATFEVPHWENDHRKLKIVCRHIPAHFSKSNTFEKKECYVEL